MPARLSREACCYWGNRHTLCCYLAGVGDRHTPCCYWGRGADAHFAVTCGGMGAHLTDLGLRLLLLRSSVTCRVGGALTLVGDSGLHGQGECGGTEAWTQNLTPTALLSPQHILVVGDGFVPRVSTFSP